LSRFGGLHRSRDLSRSGGLHRSRDLSRFGADNPCHGREPVVTVIHHASLFSVVEPLRRHKRRALAA
jgi:hypothetical protein